MSDNVIEIKPGIRRQLTMSAPLSDDFRPMSISDPTIEVDVMQECRDYILDLHARCYAHISDHELAQAINLARSTATILQALAAGRLARRASEKAVALHQACQDAIEKAERL